MERSYVKDICVSTNSTQLGYNWLNFRRSELQITFLNTRLSRYLKRIKSRSRNEKLLLIQHNYKN